MISLLSRFGLIGVVAMAVHWCVAVIATAFGVLPGLANLLGFCIAFSVAFHGHRLWTFSGHAAEYRRAQQRYFVIAVTGFAANEAIYESLLHSQLMDYRPALALTLLLIGAGSFIFSRLWAFR